MPKISVVVPVYNVEKYVAQCLDSLLGQTMHDIEIICVDDKSPDNALQILREYAARDNRVRIIEQEKNGGVSVARNTGIDAATGEYVSFVDPDDWVDADYFEKLYRKACETGADICTPAIRIHEIDGTIIENDELNDLIKSSKYNFTCFQCGSIYRSDFLRDNNIRCPTGVPNGEDITFCIYCVLKCNDVQCVLDTFYHYIRRADSAEGLFYTEKQINSRINVAKNIVQIINQENLDKASYEILFKRAFYIMTNKNMTNTTLRDLHMKSVCGALDIFKQCKYPDIFAEHNAYPYLCCDDAEGLYKFLCDMRNSKKIIRINLFRKLPFIKIDKNMFRIKVKIFGVTIFYIKHDKE